MTGRLGGRRVTLTLAGRVVLVAFTAGLLAFVTGTADAASPPVAFAPRTDYATDVPARNVAIGDLDGDTHVDLATAGPGDVVSVRFGDADGTFAAPVELDTGPAPITVAIGDVDGDGDLDLTVTHLGRSLNFDDGGVTVLLNNGDGTFAPHSEYPTAIAPIWVSIDDVNGDSDADLIVTHWGIPEIAFGGAVSVILGNGDGTFATFPEQPFYRGFDDDRLRPTAVGDITGDALPDLVVPGTGQGALPGLHVLVGNGDGTFHAPVTYGAGTLTPSGVAIEDLDGDGANEVVVADCCDAAGSHGRVLAGTADGTLGEVRDFPLGQLFLSPESLAVDDLNGDTHLDVAVGGATTSSVSVVLGNGDGTFDAPVQFAARQSTWMSVGDLSGDDRPDIVLAHESLSGLSVLFNTTVPVVPDAPTIIRNATAGDGQATVSWTAPASNGGTPITGYVVTPYVGFSPRPANSFSSTATTQTITGLSNGTQYRFRVQAVNAVGTGGYSTVTNPVTPMTPTAPDAPTIVRNATAGDEQATVSWTAPASDGGSPVTAYVVTPYVGYSPQPSQTFASTATTQHVTGLTNGTTYRFRVRAINAVGTSGYSTVTNPVTPSA